MPQVLVITGNGGVGKTTVANAWATARGGAAIHADDMHMWITVRERRRDRGYQEKWKADIAMVAAKGLLEQGLDVAIENVWIPKTLERIRNALCDVASITFVRLWCRSTVNHTRDLQRPSNAVLGSRIDVLEAELAKLEWPGFVHTLDTSEQTLDETLRAINLLSAA